MTDTSKISKILEEKHDSMAASLWEEMKPKDWSGSFEYKLEESWVEFLNHIDCTIITHEDIREDLEDIINYSSRGKVCVPTRFANDCPYVLMHEELAEKILVLGGVPDSWSPESILS